MAHELGHVRNYDIRLSMIVFGLVVAVGFISDILVRLTFYGRGNNQNPIVLVFGLVALLVAPLVASLVQLAISRQREYLAEPPSPRPIGSTNAVGSTSCSSLAPSSGSAPASSGIVWPAMRVPTPMTNFVPSPAWM